ncbi:MAG: helix-turn-helix domain-containing protein [Actinomycetota bacterium]|nr:helix-turn-helix domain-containing protein [Actinomycetota bacterium]
MPVFRFSPNSLRARRKALGLSREVVALRARRGYETIRAYEQGVTVPPGDVIGRLAAALECSPNDLYVKTEAEAAA